MPHEKYLKKVGHIPAGKRRDYAATIVALDEGIGRVLAALKERGLETNTLVVCVSDNGGDVPHGGNNKPFRDGIAAIYEGGIRVPCVMRWTEKIQPAQVSSQPGSTLDLFPTICHLAGIDTSPLRLDGIDLAPALLDAKQIPRDLFWEMSNGAKAFRRGPWKFVRSAEGGEMLFNLAADPGEKENAAAQKQELLDELKTAHAAIASTFQMSRRGR